MLHGVGNEDLDLRTKVLGVDTNLPFFITSCAGQRMFHADGEIATARAAAKHGCFMALSQARARASARLSRALAHALAASVLVARRGGRRR